MSTSAARSDLLERDAALGAIDETLEGLHGGGGAVLFLVGTPGIGKTSLIRAGVRSAHAAGFRVGLAVGSPTEAELPFGLLGQAIAALGNGGVEELVGLERRHGQTSRFYRTLRWLFGQASEQPLLLALDDLHWADRDSLELLCFISRRLSGVPLVVLGALRAEPSRAYELARDLAGSQYARIVGISPLSLDASLALIVRVARRPVNGAEGERIWRACAGTPLLLELAAWSLERGRSMGASQDDEQPAPPAPGALAASAPDAALARRLMLEPFVGLGAEAFSYVSAAAILGVCFDISLAGPLARLGAARAHTIHLQLVRAGLIEDLGAGRASFVHPLFAQALTDGQPASERERLHAEAFRLMVAGGFPDALATEHAIAAGLVGDPSAIARASQAGRAAFAQGALQTAVTLLGRAVELSGHAPDAPLLLDYASALGALARIDDADAVCRELLARPGLDPALRARALALLARAEILVSRPAQAERRYEDAVAAAALAGPEIEAATLVEAALSCQVSSPCSWVLGATSRALAILPPGTPSHGRMLALQAYALLLGGDPSGAELLASETRRLTDSVGGEEEAGGEDGWAWTMAVHSLNTCKLLEDLASATELFEAQFERAVADGAPILMNALAVAYADAVHRLGRPQEALELVRRATALSDLAMAPWSDLALAVLLSELGEDEAAAVHIDALRCFRAKVPPQYHAPVSLWLDLLDARRLLADGRSAEASETMLHAAHVARLTGWREPCIVPWAGAAIDAHLAAGRAEDARALMDELEQLSRPLPCRWPCAVLELGRARLAASEGSHEEAERRFADALAIFAELPMPIARAEALLSFGAHLRRGGRPREAREPLACALELAERCGSGRLARVARAELAAAGGRRRRRSEDRDALTAQEQRVAALAAEGLTNAQIAAALVLSPKTVGHHLGHVYEKLGIASRRELIRRGHEESRRERTPD